MKANWKPFKKNEQGAVTVEVALLAMFIGALALSVIDYALIFTRSMEVANALRVGTQYATVRKPVAGDLTAIEDAVESAIPANGQASGGVLDVTLFCQCRDGTSSACLGTGGTVISCGDGSERESYLQISYSEDFSILFPYPGTENPQSISRTAIVRLN